MGNSLFGNIDRLGRALDASWTKNEVISSNIANIDTPGYKRKTVDFGDLLSEEMSSSQAKGANSRETSLSSANSTGAKILSDLSTESLRTDENNVNIDTEMSELSKNIIYYNVLSQRATGEINKLRDAITSR